MNIKKLIRKEFFIIVILIFVIFLLIKNINFFKNLHQFISLDFEKRFVKKTYNYCDEDSIGYIYDITKKFNIQNNPEVINYDVQANPSWVFLNTSKPISTEYIILLNYIKNPKVLFKKKKNFFTANNILNTSGIDSIQFFSKNGRSLKINGKLELYKIKLGTYNFQNFDKLNENNIELKKINSFKINSSNYVDGKYSINKKIPNLGGRGTLSLIKITDNKNFEINEVANIKISLINQISLDNFKILDNFKNKCFYLKKNG